MRIEKLCGGMTSADYLVHIALKAEVKFEVRSSFKVRLGS